MELAGHPSSKTTIWRSLKSMGFKFYKKHGRRFMKETQDIVATRHSYLRQVRKYRNEGYEMVYLDETWINATHNYPGEWTENQKGPLSVLYPGCGDCVRFIPTGKGLRLIVLDAGSSTNGFVEGAGLVFQSKTKSADYHDEMNGTHFLEWFEHTLLPALNGPAVIIMDNAPYHNIKTTASWYPRKTSKKEDIQKWLTKMNVPYDMDEVKAKLLVKVNARRPVQQFQTDLIANKYGHEVLRLPVKHCELNPIELIQAQEKMMVVQRNKTNKLKDIKLIFEDVKKEIGKEDWLKAEQHVIEKVENVFWDLDGVQEEEVEPVVFFVNEDDPDAEESDAEESDNDDDEEIDEEQFMPRISEDEQEEID